MQLVDDSWPLHGVRVLDCSRVVSGPWAGKLLAELGADVIRVEQPGGDIVRRVGRITNGLSSYFTEINVGKRNVCVDVKHSAGRDVFLRLARTADIVIENFRPGVVERLGIGWDDLSRDHAGLIMVSISGFGRGNVQSDRPAYAPVIHAESGMVRRQSDYDGIPAVDPLMSIADTLSAFHAVIAVLAALNMRERTGRGQYIDLSMLDVMLSSDDYAHFRLEDEPVRRVGGEVWQVAGGPIMLASLFNATWRQISQTFGLADPANPEHTPEQKAAARRETLEQWFASFETRAEAQRALDEASVVWADVLTTEEALAAPSLSARGSIVEVEDGTGGTRRVIRSPYRFSNASSGIPGPARHVGENTIEVLGDWGNYSQDEVDNLIEAGVVFTDEQLGHEARYEWRPRRT
jgi:CoA:oxalate CoA-transferase